MSTTFKTVAGDTFELISRKVYGIETEAARIAQANPGASEPLSAGLSLTIPPLPSAVPDRAQNAPAADPDEVAVTISGERFRYWSRVSIRRSIDSQDGIDLGAPFDPDAPGFRDAFRPFSYQPLAVTVGGAPLFTGTMVAPVPVLNNDSSTVAMAGYSLPGVLQDCTPPASAFPLEFNGQDLQAIATKVAGFFGIKVEFAAPAGAVFERVAMGPGQSVLDFLAGLAKQRNLVISSTERGALLFWRSVAVGNPVAILRQGESPLLSVTPNFNPQEFYSSITGIEPVVIGLSGAQYTVRNPHSAGVLRPHTFTVTDTEGADLEGATRAKIGRMLANAVGYSVAVNTWRSASGALWAPNTTLKLQAPSAMIYGEYEFLIRSVAFDRDDSSESARLDLVLPGAFSGEIPEALPWDA